MLDDLEKKECLKILEFLSYDNLVSLTDTVTGRVVIVENKQEALNAIMIYTRTGEELLRRRKVRREHLYQYLAQEGHVEHPAADKAQLLKKVLHLWQSRKTKSELKDGENEAIDIKQEEICQTDSNNCQVSVSVPSNPASSVSSDDHIRSTQSDSQVNNTQPIASVVGNEPVSSTSVKPKLYDGDESQLLALHFTAWFYQMLNSLSKSSPEQQSPDWGPQHFWEDAKLTVQCTEPTGTQETTLDGAQLVSDKFLTMVIGDQLCLNPNISSDSVRGKQNPHGLTLVMACGTVHRQKQYIGVFEQTFGLIRDPTEENNWKIKFSKLILKAEGSGSRNQLEGSC